jgi:hypothetical protein
MSDNDELSKKLARQRQLNNENEDDFAPAAGVAKTWDVNADLGNSEINVKAAGDDLLKTKEADVTKTWNVDQVNQFNKFDPSHHSC